MRRIKTVSVSVPSVVGPYTSLNCTLALQRSTLRVSPLLENGTYARKESEQDDRFVDYFGSIESVVTSSGNNDSGMFETNLRDERFLPFEGAGAISTWSLELPGNLRQFDYMTISDVILHVRYTARQGGTELGGKAIKEMRDLILSDATQSGFALLFSLQHDFPSEWASFVKGTADFSAPLRKDHFPYLVQGQTLNIDTPLVLCTASGDKLNTNSVEVDETSINLDDLNGAKGYTTFSLKRDLLKPEAASFFLLIRYSVVPSARFS